MDHAGADFASFDGEAKGVAVDWVAVTATAATANVVVVAHDDTAFTGDLDGLTQNFVVVCGWGLEAKEIGDAEDFFICNPGTLDATRFAHAWSHEEHVAFAEEFFSADLVEDGAGVDLLGDGESDAGGDIGFNEAGDDVDGWALGGEDEVDSGGAAFLGEADDESFDVAGGGHHEVGELVDNEEDVGHFTVGGRFGFAGFVGNGDFAAGFSDFRVVVADVFDFFLREKRVATLHFVDGPFEGADGFFGLGDDGCEEV